MFRSTARAAITLAAALTIATSCSPLGDYYATGSNANEMNDLFSLLKEREGQPGEDRFAVVRQIASELMRKEDYRKLTLFLSDWVAKHEDDPYAAYYLLMIAYVQLREGADPVAAYYFDRIVKNYPDLTLKGESVHLACLQQLIQLVDDPQRRVEYYKELVSRFSDSIDLGAAYFMLAQAYEKVGEWDLAIQTYTKFLPYYDTSIPGFPDAYRYAKKIVDFHNSPKDWTFESLSALVKAVTSALSRGSASTLSKYRAKVNFFAMSWEQEESDANSLVEFNLSDFMFGNRIRFSTTLDASSNASEAYLRTWGWSQRISTWYLYFRKINFPADPEIHGRWEWAGIFYGEKF